LFLQVQQLETAELSFKLSLGTIGLKFIAPMLV